MSKYTVQETAVMIRLVEASTKIAELNYPSLTFRIKVEKELLSLIKDLEDIGLEKPVKYIIDNINRESVFNKQVLKVMIEIEGLFVGMQSPIKATRKYAEQQLKIRGFKFDEISKGIRRNREEEAGEDGTLFASQG